MGPVLFTLHVSHLFYPFFSYLSTLSLAHGYAGDTQLYFSFQSMSLESQVEAIKVLESCIADVQSWFIANRLMINDIKTEFLIISSRHQLAKMAIDSVIIGESSIKPSGSVGSWFDAQMHMDVHICKTCSKAFHSLYKIRQIRRFLDINRTKTLVHVFVSSHLDYCTALLFGLPKYQLNRIQKVQTAAARVILQLSKFDHIMPAFVDLHRLPIKFRVQFKLLLIVYKSLHNQAPDYNNQRFPVYEN